MRRLLFVALCCLPAAAQPKVYEAKYQGYRYPQLYGLSSPELEARVNKELRGVFWPPQHPWGYSEMREYKIGRLDLDYISVRYTGGGIAYKAGSHNRVGAGLTLNLHTGQRIRLKDLFRRDSDWMKPLAELARPVVEKEMGLPFPDDFGKRPFGFYLTPKKLVLFDLYSGHPPWDYPVPLESLREVLDPKGAAAL